jgi:hypothetical protein
MFWEIEEGRTGRRWADDQKARLLDSRVVYNGRHIDMSDDLAVTCQTPEGMKSHILSSLLVHIYRVVS